MRTQRFITKALIVAVAACGLAACGADDDVDVASDASASVSSASTEASDEVSDSASDSSASTESSLDDDTATQSAAEASSTKTLESEPGTEGGMVTADKNALGGLKAFEEQALTMTGDKVIGDREFSPEFEKLTETVSSDAKEALSDIDSLADSTKETITAGSPAGLLSEQIVAQAGTPSGSELEMSWKAQMAKQRQAAIDWLSSNPGSNPEVKDLIDGATKNLEEQLEDLK